ncbi:hypothetical protein JCM8547_000497 [Rhodosporidiobolus lusitaniae]
MAQDAASDPLSRLPVDLLTYSLLPTCAPLDLISLALTCRCWHAFLMEEGGPCEILWKRRVVQDFYFPVQASGRRSGWLFVWRNLSKSSAYVWGQNDNGRLALPSASFRLPTSLRSRLVQGGIPLPTRLELPAPPVALVAGGWSCHALTAEGKVISWGTLDAEQFGGDAAPLSFPGRILRPMVLPQSDEIGEVVQLEAGRRHLLLLTKAGKVFELHSFGRAVEVRDEAGRWGTAAEGRDGKAVKAVQAGWDYSAVLTKSGEVYVWWQPGSGPLGRAAAEAGENDLTTPSEQGVAFPLDIDTLRPSHPSSPASPDDKIEVIACGDNFLIALTSSSQLYHLDLSPVFEPHRPLAGQGARDNPEDSPRRGRASVARLEAAFLDGRRTWKRMSRFCDSEEIEKLDDSVPSSSNPTGSIVLLGDRDWNEQKSPQVIPELQGLGVIKIAHGDYHNLALTSNGRLYSWGAFSAGALGLGHPRLTNTPLSAPISSPPPSSAAQPPAPTPLPRPVDPNRPPAQGFSRPQVQPQPPGLFPGFMQPRAAARVPPPPERVDKPTRVRFHGEAADAQEGGQEQQNKGKFVYAIAAAGWHSGCLAVDLDRASSSTLVRTEEEPMIKLPRSDQEEAQEEMRQLADEESLNGSGSWMGRLGRNLRVGLAGARRT